ncbi:MAG: flavin reductase family protein [Caldilineaceae bacterium]|nr:flavin reductase family protein [Caldilineaceae bacterium]
MAIDPQDFRTTMAQWASGVTIVTSVHNGQRVGITASSFSSLSLEPARVLICVAKRLYTHQVILESQVFAVNILAATQQELGLRFAGLLPEAADRFAGIDVFTAETGSPLLPDVLGWLDCRLYAAYDGGDHTIFVGEVVALGAAGEMEANDPILYYKRQWRALGPVIP